MNIPLSLQTDKYSALRMKNSNEKEPSRLTAELGQIISATVAEKTGKLTRLIGEGFDVEVPSDQVTGNVGDEVQFEVVKKNDNSLVLKQILKDTGEAVEAKRSNADVKELLKQNNLYSDENIYKTDDKDLQLKAMEAASKIRRQLNYVSNNSSQSAMRELLASGLSLDKISLEVLNSVMREIERKPDHQVRGDELDRMINRYLREHNLSAKDSTAIKEISGELSRQGLPVTQKNVEAVSEVLAKLKAVENLDIQAVAKLIKDGSPLTVENLYLAKHTTATPPKGLSDETWDDLQPEIAKTFAREGVAQTEKNLQAARLLVENEIPITKDNIDKLLYLTGEKNYLRNIDKGQVLKQAVTNLRQGAEPSNIPTDNLTKAYSNLRKEISQVTGSHIEYILRSKQSPTLEDLTSVLKQNVPAVAEADLSEKALSARQTMLEIQRKLTAEAIQRLAAKSVSISNLPLEGALSALNEADAYAANLRAMGAEVTESNVSQMNELYTKLGEIKNPPAEAFAVMLSRTIPFTVNGVHRAATAARLAAGYEAHATTVNAKYDKLTEVNARLSNILQDMGIDATDVNIKAAKILSKSGVDITADNLAEVKLMDQRLNALQSRLHPNIAASMLRDGINPLETKVDDILEYADKFNGMYGEDAGENLARHIRAMDDKKELDPDQRKQMMAFYRTLNILAKDDSAVLGLSLKYGGDLTLGNMLSDAEYYSRGKNLTDVSVDDSFGELVNSGQRGESIRKILGEIPSRALTDYQYNSIIVDRMAVSSQPGAVQNLLSQPEGIPAEEAANLLEEYTADEDGADVRRVKEMLDILKNVTGLSGDAVKTLQRLQMPATILNLQAARLMAKNSFALGTELENLERDFELDSELDSEGKGLALELPDADLTQLKNGATADEILEGVSNQLEAAKDEPLPDNLLRRLKLAQSAVQVQRFAARQDNRMSVPIRLQDGERIANLHMYVLDEAALSKGSADLLMALNTENLGNVQVFIAQGEGDGLRMELTTDKASALPHMEKNSGALLRLVEEAGFDTTDVSFSLRSL